MPLCFPSCVSGKCNQVACSPSRALLSEPVVFPFPLILLTNRMSFPIPIPVLGLVRHGLDFVSEPDSASAFDSGSDSPCFSFFGVFSVAVVFFFCPCPFPCPFRPRLLFPLPFPSPLSVLFLASVYRCVLVSIPVVWSIYVVVSFPFTIVPFTGSFPFRICSR